MNKISLIISNRMQLLFTDKFNSMEECIAVWNSIRHLEGVTIHDYKIEEIYNNDNGDGTYTIMVIHSIGNNSITTPLPQFLEYISLLIFGNHDDPETSEFFEQVSMRA